MSTCFRIPDYRRKMSSVAWNTPFLSKLWQPIKGLPPRAWWGARQAAAAAAAARGDRLRQLRQPLRLVLLFGTDEVREKATRRSQVPKRWLPFQLLTEGRLRFIHGNDSDIGLGMLAVFFLQS